MTFCPHSCVHYGKNSSIWSHFTWYSMELHRLRWQKNWTSKEKTNRNSSLFYACLTTSIVSCSHESIVWKRADRKNIVSRHDIKMNPWQNHVAFKVFTKAKTAEKKNICYWWFNRLTSATQDSLIDKLGLLFLFIFPFNLLFC